MNAARKAVPIHGPRAHLPGLPSQRTLMAWDRTALALIGHGALLVIRHPGDGGPARWTPAALSLALALLVAVLGRLRAIEIADSDQTRRAHVPTFALVTLAAGLLVLGVLDLVAIASA
jgi:putative membrane protein